MVVSRRGAPSRAPRGVSESTQQHRILVGDCVAEMAKLERRGVIHRQGGELHFLDLAHARLKR